MIRRAVSSSQPFALRPLHFKRLHRLAIDDIYVCAGRFRDDDVQIDHSDHEPAPWADVPWYIDDMCGYVNDEWGNVSSIHLGAYLMWRVNWVHPFFGGNGRTSRAAAYMVMCIHMATPLPGVNTIPEQIMRDRSRYYDALAQADANWEKERLNVSALERLVDQMLFAQLADTANLAGSSYRARGRRRTTRRRRRE